MKISCWEEACERSVVSVACGLPINSNLAYSIDIKQMIVAVILQA